MLSEMCKAMEELRVESRKEMAIEMAQSLYEQGVSIEQIAKASKVDVDTVKGWLTPKAGACGCASFYLSEYMEHASLHTCLRPMCPPCLFDASGPVANKHIGRGYARHKASPVL